MAVVDVQETMQRDHEVAFDPQRGWVRTYRRTWQVLTSTTADGPLIARGAIPVALGNTYAYGIYTDIFAFVQAIRVRCTDEDGLGYEVTAEYGPHDPTVRPENPLEEPPEVSTDYVQFERQVDIDRNGTHVVNSAGDPFDPGLVYDDSRPVVQVTRNEATFSLALAYQYRDAVNSGDWLGAPAGTVKASPVKGRRLWHPIPGWYWQVAYEFQFNPDGWTRKVLDAGMREYITGGSYTNHYKAIVDQEGVPVATPVPLDGAGRKLGATTGQVGMEFEIYQTIDFSIFGLDGVLDGIFA